MFWTATKRQDKARMPQACEPLGVGKEPQTGETKRAEQGRAWRKHSDTDTHHMKTEERLRKSKGGRRIRAVKGGFATSTVRPQKSAI